MGTFPNPDTQFKPGESGNLNGRPPGPSRATRLKKMIELAAQDGFKAMLEKRGPVKDLGLPVETVEDQVEISLLLAAMSGDMAAIKEFKDTLYGKITEKIQNEHTFTQMGRVALRDEKGEVAASLEFDVGLAAEAPVQE